jgi:hypothetical protein
MMPAAMIHAVLQRSVRVGAPALAFWLTAVGCARSQSASTGAVASGSSTPVVSSAVAAPPRSTEAPAASPTHDKLAASASAEPASLPSASVSSHGDAGLPKAARAGAGPQLELLDAGNEPRTALRYKFTPGKTERVKVINGTTLVLEVGGQKVPSAKMPDIELTTALKVLSLTPDGGAKRELSVERVELAETGALDDSIRDQLMTALEAIKGVKGRDAIDSRGRLKSVKIDAGPQAGSQITQLLDQMQQSFAQMGAPFPEEAIGVGARWTVTTVIEQQGMKVQQVATYELTEQSGNKGRAKLRLTQLAPRGPIKPPGLPAGVKAELLSMSSRGNGDLTFDLTRSVPEGEIKTKAKLQVRTSMAAETQDTKMDIDVRVRFVREP